MRLREMEDAIPQERAVESMVLRLPTPPGSGRVVFTIKEGSIGHAADKPLHQHIGARIERGMKVALVGTNGIGKSTFLRSLAGVLHL